MGSVAVDNDRFKKIICDISDEKAPGIIACVSFDENGEALTSIAINGIDSSTAIGFLEIMKSKLVKRAIND